MWRFWPSVSKVMRFGRQESLKHLNRLVAAAASTSAPKISMFAQNGIPLFKCRAAQHHTALDRTSWQVAEQHCPQSLSLCRNISLKLQDPFGNYVVQYVLELGHVEATATIMRQLYGQYPELAQQKFSSNVVEKCLKLGGPGLAECRERVIRELMVSPLLPRLLQVRSH